MNTEILEDLGLTNAEIKVYIALLELGSSTAGPILEKSNLQNSVVHRAFHTLIEKGLISYIMEGKRKHYQATDPENFQEFIEDKKRRFNQILPELKQKQEFAKEQKEATIFKGKRGLTEMYTKIINSSSKEYNTFGGGKKVTYEIMGESWWRNIQAKRIEKKLFARQVFDESIRGFGIDLEKLPLTDIRFLPQKYSQLTETIICGEYVGIAIFTEQPYGVLIRDKEVVNSYKKNFEYLWKQAKD